MHYDNSTQFFATERSWLVVREDYQDWHQLFVQISLQLDAVLFLMTAGNRFADSTEAHQATHDWYAKLDQYRPRLTRTVDTLQRALDALNTGWHTGKASRLVSVHPIVSQHMNCFAIQLDELLTEFEAPR